MCRLATPTTRRKSERARSACPWIAPSEQDERGWRRRQAPGREAARVVLVVDDEFALGNLAVYVAAYAHWGFELLIDTATFLRTGVTRVPAEAVKPTVPEHATAEHTPDSLGMALI